MNRLERPLEETGLAWEAVGPIEHGFWIVTNYGSRAFLFPDWLAASAYLLAKRLNREGIRPADRKLAIIARELNVELVRLDEVLGDRLLGGEDKKSSPRRHKGHKEDGEEECSC